MDNDKYFDENGMISPFYRVSVRAVIRDADQHVLVLENHDHTYELPGGGWEFDESLEEGLRRELEEECGAKLTKVGAPLFVYRGANDGRRHRYVRIMVSAEIAPGEFNITDPEFLVARYVGKEEFARLPWSPPDVEVLEHIDTIWP